MLGPIGTWVTDEINFSKIVDLSEVVNTLLEVFDVNKVEGQIYFL
jgi:hypothetical protein|tara:strand:- start:220 stop:354 length:135 start_codon:yes stop_codon:yes gene_type:complete